MLLLLLRPEACLGGQLIIDSMVIQLDMRSPGSPVVELKGHGRVGGRVTSLGWGEKGPSGTGGGLCTGGKFARFSLPAYFLNLQI